MYIMLYAVAFKSVKREKMIYEIVLYFIITHRILFTGSLLFPLHSNYHLESFAFGPKNFI